MKKIQSWESVNKPLHHLIGEKYIAPYAELISSTRDFYHTIYRQLCK